MTAKRPTDTRRAKGGVAKPGAPPPAPGVFASTLGALGRAALSLAFSEAGARAALLALVLAAIVVSSERVRREVLAQEDLVVDRAALAAAIPPELTASARADLERLPLPERVSAFEPALVPVLAQSLGALAWVDRVDSVRLDFPPRLSFALRTLRPIARTGPAGHEWLVARDGRSVPQETVAEKLESFPRIDGLPAPEAPAERSAALEAGLALLQGLRARGLDKRVALRSIDVSNWDGRRDRLGGKLVLVCGPDGATRIEWGRPVDDPARKLEGFLAKGPKLDEVQRLSLRWEEPVFVPRPVVEPKPEPTTLPASIPHRRRG